MLYKVGDKVKVIKKDSWNDWLRKRYEKLPDGVTTIIQATPQSLYNGRSDFYKLEGLETWDWYEEELEIWCEKENIKEVERFDLLDFD